MTNEEKAREIGLGFWGVEKVTSATAGALEMAEWKDNSFKEYLEKKEKHYRELLCIWRDLDPEATGYIHKIDFIDEIINELFKED